MKRSALRYLREIVASLICSPLYFQLSPPQRLALVKALAKTPQVGRIR